MTPVSCKYLPGQIVHHKKYDYRGVIYDVDDQCRADEEWYRKNKTQPSKQQPWYHVLVDGESQTTYVAEENLELDDSADPVEHPLVEQFFNCFSEGKYYRDYNS